MHRLWADILSSGVHGLSHEDGWTLLPTAKLLALEGVKSKAMDVLAAAGDATNQALALWQLQEAVTHMEEIWKT